MFKKFFERAAAKASLTNMKFDLDHLRSSFPHNIQSASKALFKLLENMSLAFANNASEAEVEQVLVAKAAEYPTQLREIVDHLFHLIVASRRGDTAAVSLHDSRINEIFQTATGQSIEVSKLPWFSKLAMQSGR